jgi:uncharacterized membrane protein
MPHHHRRANSAAKRDPQASGKVVLLSSVSPKIAEIIRREFPTLGEHEKVSAEMVNAARIEYVRGMLMSQVGELSKLDEEVISSLHDQEMISASSVGEEDEASATFGERLSDKIAEFGGSWTFIMAFGVFMGGWITLNVVAFANRGFDPYPFILLNLILSCLASLQAPVIMMSQNRQEIRDRRRAESDYKVNLKAELEIRHLHEKVDYLLHQQATRLLEIQQLQLEAMGDAAQDRKGGSGP